MPGIIPAFFSSGNLRAPEGNGPIRSLRCSMKKRGKVAGKRQTCYDRETVTERKTERKSYPPCCDNTH